MACVLHAIDPEAKLPRQEQKLAAIYQAVLEGKRVLLLLDDAENAEQVAPLIPPKGCGCVVTSLQPLSLSGFSTKELDALRPADACDLLLKIEPRAGAEAPDIADLCGYVPLAIRLAASTLAEHPELIPADYRKRLAEERNQPKLLGEGNEEVEAAIGLGHSFLDPDTQRRWRMLGTFVGTFDRPAAAAVWNADETSAEDTLDLLAACSLLEWSEHTQRYRMHDLLRDFACLRLKSEEWNEAALGHAQYYRDLLHSSDDLYLDGGDSLARGLAMFDLEQGNIEAGQSWAASHAHGNPRAAALANDYPKAAAHCLALRQHPRERIHWLEDALSAAIQLNDRAAERAHLGNLAAACRTSGEYRRAIEYYEKHLEIARELGDRHGESQDLANLGDAYDFLGDYPRAIKFYEQQLEIARSLDDRRREGNALSSLGSAYHSIGDYGAATRHHEQSVRVYRELGDWRGAGIALGNLGIAYYRLGEHRQAIACFQDQLHIVRRMGDRHGEGNSLWNMSLALDELGERKKAIEYAGAALEIRQEIDDPNAAKVRRQLEEWQKQ
jgi:tetratricopeptide (TPR) repeat protein